MRVALTGASGWLARSAFSALNRLKNEGVDVSCTMFSSIPRQIELRDGVTYRARSMDELMEGEFDLYVPLAFLTQEKFQFLGKSDYTSLNLGIIQRDIEVIQRNSLVRVLLMSSGVVIDPSGLQSRIESYRCYADLKKLQELKYCDVLGNQNISVCYLYSCTSIDIPQWQNYAFSSIVHDAIYKDSVLIKNPKRVTRRYVDARDLFYVMFKHLKTKQSFRISSGGPLIELEDLANLAISTLESSAKVIRAEGLSRETSDEYYAKDDSMENLFAQNHYPLPSIEQQILTTSKIFLES